MKWFWIVLGVIVGTIAAMFAFLGVLSQLFRMTEINTLVLCSVFVASVNIICAIIILEKIKSSGK